MFNNYAICDLWSNIYKNRKKNLILALIIFCAVLMPFVLKATRSNAGEVPSMIVNYSLYVAYDIDSGKIVIKDDVAIEPYSDFYKELIKDNLNGAYLFNDTSEQELNAISQELQIDPVQLRSSDSNFWDGKIVVSSMPLSGTVSVKVLTQSSAFNEIVAEKVNTLVQANVIDDVSVKKISEVSTSDPGVSVENNEPQGINKGMLLKGIIISLVFAVFCICATNFVCYIFNPSINEGAAYKNYGLDFIYNFDTAENCAAMLKYKQKECGNFVLVATNKKVMKKFEECMKKENVNIPVSLVGMDNLPGVLEGESILFVEEYGITRFSTFENAIQQAQNVHKPVIGVVNLPL